MSDVQTVMPPGGRITLPVARRIAPDWQTHRATFGGNPPMPDEGKSGAGGGAGSTGGMANPPSPPSPTPSAPGPFDEAALTSQQEQQLRDVISQSVSGLGSSFSAGALESAINSKLQALGWTPGMILAAQKGENVSEPHGSGFVEQNKSGSFGAAAARDWGANLISSVDSYLSGWFMAKPPATPAPDTGSVAPGTPDKPIEDLTNPGDLLVGAGSLGVPGGGSIGSMIPTFGGQTTSSGGANTIAIVAIIGALALIGFYVYKTSKKSKHESASAAA